MHIEERDFGDFRIYAAAVADGARFRPAVAVRDRRRPADAAPVYINRQASFWSTTPQVALRFAIELGELAAASA